MVSRGPLFVLAGAAACAAGAGLVGSHLAGKIPVPSSRAALAGSGSCQGCHPKFYELWSTSHHGLAMQPVSAEFVRRNLNLSQPPVRVGQATYAPEVDAKSAWLVERSPQGTRRYRLEQALGGDRIAARLSAQEARRLLYRLGEACFRDKLLLQWAGEPAKSPAGAWRMLLDMADSWQRPRFPLSGRDVMLAGVPEGPEVGRVLAALQDWWVQGDFAADESALRDRLKEMIRQA